jgi:hypothetical protein
MRFAGVLWLCVLVSMPAGCSFALVSGPPPRHEELPEVSCSETSIWPVVDFVVASIFFGQSLGALAIDVAYGRAGAVSGGLAMTGVFTVSGFTGLRRIGRCREAKEQRRRRDRPRPAPGSPWDEPPEWGTPP